MKRSGQIVLFSFPFTDLSSAKMRPALLLEKLPGPFDDWLICMISSQLKHAVKDFDGRCCINQAWLSFFTSPAGGRGREGTAQAGEGG